MGNDKYSALWVSYTSINDFLHCPRAYFLKNVYRDPVTRHKIKLVTPALTLGQAIHEVIDWLSQQPKEKRMKESPVIYLDKLWTKYTGKRGGFFNPETELICLQRGKDMLNRIMKKPGIILNPAVKIKSDLPYYWLSDEANIILCGKIDWIEYIQEKDSIHIVDFKTGRGEEDKNSLQLGIYGLLARNLQSRPITKMSYWYIDRDDEPKSVTIPDFEQVQETTFKIAKQIKTARQLNLFKCPHQNGCIYCRSFEKILKKEAEFIGVNSYNEDLFILESIQEPKMESVIL